MCHEKISFLNKVLNFREMSKGKGISLNSVKNVIKETIYGDEFDDRGN